MTNNNAIDQSGQDNSSVDQLKCRWSTHHFGIAEDYGMSESVFVSYIWFWTKRNSEALRNFKDGRTWTYDSLKNICEKIGYWTVDQLRAVIKKCINSGLIIVSSYNKMSGDRTSWYSLTDTAFQLCATADSNPLILNFQQLHDKDQQILALKAQLNEQDTPCGEIPTWFGETTAALPVIQPVIPSTVCIKEFKFIGNPQSHESTTPNQTFLKKEEQTQDPILEHMLANPLGCSSDKLEAYRAHRGHRISIKTWDSAVKIYLEICFKQPTSISPDQALDALLKRTDGCTDFDTIFPGTKQAANIRAFEKEAAEHDLARGQDIDSLIAEFKRVGIKHNLSQDFDYKSYYAERGRKEAAARNAENMLTSNAHHNPYSGNSDSNQSSMESAALNGSLEKTYESYSEEDIKDEPAYRQQIIRAQRASIVNPPVSIESNKTAPIIDSEMTMDDSKAISVELMEDPFTSTTGICVEPIANAVCDLPLNIDDFSAEGVAIIGAATLLFTKLLSKKSVEEHVNISSAKDLFGGLGKPVLLDTGKIINF